MSSNFIYLHQKLKKIILVHGENFYCSHIICSDGCYFQAMLEIYYRCLYWGIPIAFAVLYKVSFTCL